jgi:hypothetical protein
MSVFETHSGRAPRGLSVSTAVPRAWSFPRTRRASASLVERFARLQLARPIPVLLSVAVVAALALGLAMRLTILTGFESLLPDSRPSVKELERVAARTSGVSTIFVVLEGERAEGLRAAADSLVRELDALGPPWIGEAEDGVQDVERFLEPRAGLFAKEADLASLRDDVEARFAYEVGEKLGTNLDLDPADVPPPIDPALVEKRLHARDLGEDRFPGGYYQSADGRTVVVAARSSVTPSDLGRGKEALAKVRAVVERAGLRAFDPSIRWGITGDLAIAVAEYDAIHRDLTDVGIAGAALVLGAVLLHYLRLRALLAMTITIGIGLAWTFGLTELLLGHLNLATGFLFTIVGGNGINFALIFMGRYLEERRGGADLAGAIGVAQRETWKPTLTAAAAAAASYGSLLVTEFRGFGDFGVIGSVGMIVCWVATYLALPSILVVMERIAPLDRAPRGWLGKLARATRDGVEFGRPFAWLAERAPRAISVAGLGLAVLGLVAAVRYARTDPMEYDLTRVQSDARATAEEVRLIEVAKRITGYVGLDGMAVLVDRTDQVAPLEAALLARRDAAPAALKPFEAVHALQDLVPRDQPQKLAILRQLAERVRTARRRRLVSDADWAKIERYLPPDDLRPFGVDDLPQGLARAFTERDGTRGRVVYISPTEGEAVSDARYLFRWADAFRRTELPDGSVVLGSGRAVIFADMWAAIIADVPRAVSASFAMTVLVVAIAFRARGAALRVLGALLVGVAWMVGLLAAAHVKLNFLNFIALPITFGIGVDYAVNIVQRDLASGDVVDVVRRTGGTVVLCSLTTLLGYLALVRSVNIAVKSLGVAAVIGEIACLLAAVLVLPAALVWWRSARRAEAVR